MNYDAHIHIALSGENWKESLARHAQGCDQVVLREVLAAYAQAGYTYLRDGGDKYAASLEAARLASEYGIEYATPVWPLYPKGQYGGFIGCAFADFDEYRRLVDQLAQRGAHFVKLMLSGILDFTEYGKISSPGLTPGEVGALVAYAHEQSLPVMAHVNTAPLVAAALDAHADSIEHGYLLDDATCEKLAKSNAVWVPTLVPLVAAAQAQLGEGSVIDRLLALQRKNIAAVAAAGGFIALGSDAGAGGVFHVEGAQREAELMREILAEGCDGVLQRGFDQLHELFRGNASRPTTRFA